MLLAMRNPDSISIHGTSARLVLRIVPHGREQARFLRPELGLIPLEEVHEAIYHGVVMMKIDTDTECAFTRAVADHMEP